MNYNINLVERLVLESLQARKKNISELETCTSLNRELIQTILQSLISKSLIITEETKYRVNNNLSKAIKDGLNNSLDIKIELAEILNATYNLRKGDTFLKLQKVHMNEKEEKLFHGMLYNMESFLKNLEKKDEKLSKKKVIFWGGGNYGKLINNYLTF